MKLTNEQLDEILQQAGLRLAQPYNADGKYRKAEWLYTSCIDCGTEAHYRLKYILDKNDIQEPVCRACYWMGWYGWAGNIYDGSVQTLLKQGYSRKDLIDQGVIKLEKDKSWSDAELLATRNDYILVDLLHGKRPGNDILIVKCKSCERQTAERPDDIVFGCSCGGRKNGGVIFGHEDRKPITPLNCRDIAPRTPSALGLNKWLSKNSPNPEERIKANETICQIENSGNCLRETNPELSEEWVKPADGSHHTPDTIKSGSKRKVLWRCIACGHEWTDTVRSRELRMNNRCPHCGKIMGSLAWKYPELAKEWSPANPISPWNIKPFSQLEFIPTWICSTNPNHTWTATITSRTKGRKPCPYCSEK